MKFQFENPEGSYGIAIRDGQVGLYKYQTKGGVPKESDWKFWISANAVPCAIQALQDCDTILKRLSK